METLPSATRALLRALGPFKPAFESRLTQYLVALDPGETSAELWLDVLDEVLAQERNGRISWIENAEMLHEFRWGAVVVDRLIRKGLHVLVCAREALALPGSSRVPPNERYAGRVSTTCGLATPSRKRSSPWGSIGTPLREHSMKHRDGLLPF